MWVLRESVSLGVAGKGSVAEYIHQALSVDVYSCGNLAYSMEFHLKVFVNFLLLFSSLCRPETLGTSLYLARHLEYGDFCGNFCLTAWLPFDGASTYRSFWNAAWGYYHLPHWGQPKLQTPGQALDVRFSLHNFWEGQCISVLTKVRTCSVPLNSAPVFSWSSLASEMPKSNLKAPLLKTQVLWSLRKRLPTLRGTRWEHLLKQAGICQHQRRPMWTPACWNTSTEYL